MSVDVAIGAEELPEKTPMYAHCGDCPHEWIAAWLPMPLYKAAKVLKGVRCPMCASGKVFCNRRDAEPEASAVTDSENTKTPSGEASR